MEIGASIAKFDEESVGEVRFGVALQKPDKNLKILISKTVQNPRKKFVTVRKMKCWGSPETRFGQV